MLTCSMIKFISLLLLGLCACVVSMSCGRIWYVCKVVLAPYADAVVAVTVMRVLLFVLHVCMLMIGRVRGCGNAGVGMEEVWLW